MATEPLGTRVARRLRDARIHAGMTVREAAAELSSKYPPEDVSLYLATLVSQDPETWEGLIEVADPALKGA